ncbi:MAG: DNA-binding response regulator, partial [Candidatus Fonsibacter ubiquis]|nr:DNA-binding response regulator [Candidatus Fonsibacter ubiquis]
MNKNLPTKANLGQFENKSLLIVDDDDPFRNRLSKAMENKGFLVTS